MPHILRDPKKLKMGVSTKWARQKIVITPEAKAKLNPEIDPLLVDIIKEHLDLYKNSTIHGKDRSRERTNMNFELMTEDIANNLDQAEFCTKHLDYRIMGDVYVYHFGLGGELITIYKLDLGKLKRKQHHHDRQKVSPEVMASIIQLCEYKEKGEKTYLGSTKTAIQKLFKDD